MTVVNGTTYNEIVPVNNDNAGNCSREGFFPVGV